MTEKQFIQWNFARDDAAKQLGKTSGIADWISVNQIVPISLFDWLNLTPLMQRAIALEVEEVARQREQNRRQTEQKLDSLAAQANAKLNFPHGDDSSVSRLIR